MANKKRPERLVQTVFFVLLLAENLVQLCEIVSSVGLVLQNDGLNQFVNTESVNHGVASVNYIFSGVYI